MSTFNTTGFRCNVLKELRVIVIRSLIIKSVKKGKRNVSRSFQYERSLGERVGVGIKQSLGDPDKTVTRNPPNLQGEDKLQ